MTDIVKKLKLNLLQKLYKNYSLIISNLGYHIDNLNNNYLIDYSFKQTIMNKLNDLNRNINTSYNNYVVENLDNNSEFDKNISDLIKNIKAIDENILIKEIQFFIKHMNQDILPFNKHRNELIQIISLVGYTNLIDMLEFLIGDNFINKLEITTFKKIQEYNSIFIPLSFDYFQVNKEEEIYWRKPNKQPNKDTNDLLELICELWLKNPCGNNKNYFKINGFFKNDTIGVIFKTSQINYPFLYNIKNNIEKAIDNSSVDNKFAKKFIRHDYLGNLYCLTTNEYIKYLEKMYKKFMELSTSTFLTIMKEFIAQGTHLKVMYDVILLLLQGTVDNIDIAGLLLGLTKEKKSASPNIHGLIINRLPFSLQIKLKKSNNTIKQELERLKGLTTEDIDYKKQIVSNKNIPDNVKTLTLEKIQEMKLYNNEYYKQLTFVKHIINYPWTSSSDDLFYESLKSDSKKALDYLKNIENQLMKSSYGHEEAKKSLLQIIGKWISNPSSQGTSFGLVGPPGVGKTLLAKSVSSALGIPFAQITLGGQNDGELLHGHGYTYSGSQPGLIIKKMVEAGKSRCILYFDELDKATSKHGHINEITSILIHLTDPNMNKTFQDRFFQGVEFPLDKVIFIFSYNDSSLVDPILLDRLKEINVKPYTSNEKIKIVKEFVIPEMKESIGLHNDKWINLKDDVIEYIIDNYTNEAGVRDIKRYIEKMFLTLNLDKIYKNINIDEINIDTVNKLLDKPVQEQTKIHSKPLTGIINGLYATNNGDGGIIPIQIFNNFSSSPNSFEIKLTGKQGDVMKESVHCSLTAAIDYIRRNIKKFKHIKNLDDYLIKNFKYGFHIHAPSTSTPKDGPSAGCAFTSAFISRILNKPIKNDIAMTGEIELTGRITKIGGLNFKLIGAKKAGVKLVFVPLENKKDLEEIKEKYPKLLDENFQAKYFEYIDDIINQILID